MYFKIFLCYQTVDLHVYQICFFLLRDSVNLLVFMGRTVNITLKVTVVKDVPTVSMAMPPQEQPLTVDPVLAP